MKALGFLIVPLVLFAAPAAARPCDDGRLGHLGNALEAGRLVQADRMITTMQRDCRENVRFGALTARYRLQAGRFAEAYVLFAALAVRAPTDPEIASGAGRSALHLGRDQEAYEWLTRATANGDADWRTWNAVAILHDRRREWEASERAYVRATQLAPYEGVVWSNRGYSLMLQRRPAEAIPMLDRALSLAPDNATMVRTREMAQALNGTYDDARRRDESAADWAERLNNMGYAAWLAGDAQAARSLLARAIEVSERRFERAEHNLARVEGRE